MIFKWVSVPNWQCFGYITKHGGYEAHVAWFEEGDAKVEVFQRRGRKNRKHYILREHLEDVTAYDAQKVCEDAIKKALKGD